jgi:hypothetical protein
MKRIHLKQQPPEIHGMIAEHMASHGHKSMEDTVTCLIQEAMRRYDETDKIADLTTLVNLYGSENDKLKTALDALKIQFDKLKRKEIPAKTFDEAFQRYGI